MAVWEDVARTAVAWEQPALRTPDVRFILVDVGALLQSLMQWLLVAILGLALALVALTALVLVGLILALLRDPLAGFLSAICRFVTWPLAAVARGALRSRAALRTPMRRAFAGLHYTAPDRIEEEPSSWQGWDVAGPLIYLAFLVLLGAGDFFFMMQRFAALFGLGGTSTPPISLDLLLGILWVVMVATFGSVLFDLHGVTPIARPYHNAGPSLRRALKVIVWACLSLSFLAGALFWIWGQLRITPASDASFLSILGVTFVALFAVLLNVAVFLSGWAVLASLGVFSATGLSLARVLLWLIYGLLELLVRLVNGLTRVLVALIDIPARVGRVVYNWATKFDWARNRFLFEIPPFEAPELPGIEVDDLLETPATDSSAQLKVPPMLPGRAVQDTVIAGLGDAGERLLLELVGGDAPKLGPTTVLAVGAVNDTLTAGDAQSTRLRVRNVSPQRRELRLATDGKAGPDRARHQLISDMIDRLIKVQSLARLARGQMLVLADLAAIDEASARVLGDVDRRVQGESVVLYALLPHRGQRDSELADAFRRVLRLHQENAVSATILVDPSGPFATSYGEQLLSQFAVAGLSGLFGAAAHARENLSVAQVMTGLGQQTGLIGMAFGGRRLIPLNAAGTRGAARSGSPFPDYRLTEMVAKAVEATEAALSDPGACALESSPWGADTLALVYTVPLSSQDPRWDEFIESIRARVSKELAKDVAMRETAPTLLFVPGLGLATDGLIGRDFGVQVTAFYPIPRAPKPMRPYIVEMDADNSRPDSAATNPQASVPRGAANTSQSNGVGPH